MSDMVERTLTALPGLFLQNQLGGPAASRAPFFSRLGGLIRGVTALSSKHEEEKLIQQELSNLKATVSAPTTTLVCLHSWAHLPLKPGSIEYAFATIFTKQLTE
ncbi:hypothetical protein U0070_018071 [Myodes glareolus]|uniref:Uncharacterized protein n=1 Tax=Myodes glareolus TaxID=447135 RepID=A0AAW0IK04_MYOGA